MDSSVQPLKRPPGLEVLQRRMKFDFEDGFDRYWHGGSAFKSVFWAQLSTAFEPGEKFFIDSARALRGPIKDEALLRELSEFCKQEGQHTFQHLKFDAVNAANGLDVRLCTERYRKVLDRVRRRLDPLGMLCVTVALEHFTAGLAEIYLTQPDVAEGADPKVSALWTWHAVEESEHKGTCYDIYVAAGGGYARRAVMMPLAWLVLLWVSLRNTYTLLRQDKRLLRWDTLRGLNYLFGVRGVFTRLLPTFLDFYRRDFHPWDHDNSADIRKWQAHNAKYIRTGPGAAAA